MGASANVTMEEVDVIEMIGGGMRVPKVQSSLISVLGDVELGMHINSDESMALGAAFYGANISSAFRVRQVGLTDINPFPIGISLENLEQEKKPKKGEEPWGKKATIFKANGKIGVKKTIAFTHDQDVHCSLDYAEPDTLPEGAKKELQRYKISGVASFAKEMEEKGLGKPKVSLQFELSSSGTTSLVKAEAAVEEKYTVEVEVEVEDDEDTEAGSNETSSSEDKDGSEEKSNETAKDDEKKDDEKKDDEKKSEENAESQNDTSTGESASEEKEEPKKKKTKLVEKIFGVRKRKSKPAFIPKLQEKK